MSITSTQQVVYKRQRKNKQCKRWKQKDHPPESAIFQAAK